MNIQTISMSYDINRKTPVDMIAVTHINDVSARVLELTLYQNGEKMTVDSGCEVLASIVDRNTKQLIMGEITCSVTQDGNILVPVDTLPIRARHDLHVEVSITDLVTEQTLTLPYPIFLRVNPSVLDDAEPSETSEGTVPELLEAARKALAESAGAAVVPSYWQAEIEDTIGKIRALQDEGGSRLLCFGWCSDMHVPAGGTPYEKNLGAVAASVMKACRIPLFLMTGDMLTEDTTTTLAQIPNAYAKVWEYLSPIGTENILAVKGSHDAWTGNDGSYNTYVRGLSPEKLYRQLFAPQAKDFRRVFGDDGSYFYVDNLPQKTRFICLNSQWGAYAENASGTVKYSTQKGAGFGQAQLDWLSQTALNVPADYAVIVGLHMPPSDALPDGKDYATNYSNRDFGVLRGILTAYCQKTTYSGSYQHLVKGAYLQEGTWADVQITCDFSNSHGTLLGIFCGHSHADQFVKGDLPAPVVCITSAVNTPHDTAASVRVLGTSDETAMDFVCIHRDTGKIDLIRCGYGADRVIS